MFTDPSISGYKSALYAKQQSENIDLSIWLNHSKSVYLLNNNKLEIKYDNQNHLLPAIHLDVEAIEQIYHV